MGDLNVEWIEGENLMASHELNDKEEYVRTNAIDYIKDKAKITRIRLKPFSKQEVRGYTYTFRIYNISFYKSKEDAELWKANQLGREFEDYIDSTTGLVVDLKDSLNKNWYKIGKDKYDLRTLTTDKNRI
jgi:hypothetical protein